MIHALPDSYKPVSHIICPDKAYKDAGDAALLHGKVGAIISAGGHGSRLGYDAPKGCFPVYENKSLFELFAERTLKASKKYGQMLRLAIMTSDATHDATIEHFEKANYFGLNKEQVAFFMQENLPLQDGDGNNVSLTAPDGNGALFWHFKKSGHLALWKSLGIQHIITFSVDNALANPFEPYLVGINALHNNDVTLIGIKREAPQEQVGVLIEKEEKVLCIEYSEMPDSERLAVTPEGTLKYPLANISYFAFSMAFIERVLINPPTILPLHKAKKKVRYNGREDYFYKSEYFIFDLLPLSQKTEVLLMPREEIFAPLKNATGPASPETVRAALEKSER